MTPADGWAPAAPPAPEPGPARSAPPTRALRTTAPTDALERSLVAEGYRTVVGLDEVGRGAWAGPVSVGAAVFAPGVPAPDDVRDSKELSEPRREALFPAVAAWAVAWSVGHAGPDEVDRWGMTAALGLAAARALGGLPGRADVVLVDGPFDYVSGPAAGPDGERPAVRTVVRGDRACVSIAAASILAKVTRDRLMRSLAPSFPAFDFDRNKGYPSPAHRTALAGQGLTSLHRRSWSYVADLPFR